MRSSIMVLLTVAMLALAPSYAQTSTGSQNTDNPFTYSHESPMDCLTCHHTAPDFEGNGHGGRHSQIIAGVERSQNANNLFAYSHERPEYCDACHHTAPDFEGNGHGGQTSQIIASLD